MDNINQENWLEVTHWPKTGWKCQACSEFETTHQSGQLKFYSTLKQTLNLGNDDMWLTNNTNE